MADEARRQSCHLQQSLDQVDAEHRTLGPDRLRSRNRRGAIPATNVEDPGAGLGDQVVPDAGFHCALFTSMM